MLHNESLYTVWLWWCDWVQVCVLPVVWWTRTWQSLYSNWVTSIFGNRVLLRSPVGLCVWNSWQNLGSNLLWDQTCCGIELLSNFSVHEVSAEAGRVVANEPSSRADVLVQSCASWALSIAFCCCWTPMKHLYATNAWHCCRTPVYACVDKVADTDTNALKKSGFVHKPYKMTGIVFIYCLAVIVWLISDVSCSLWWLYLKAALGSGYFSWMPLQVLTWHF